MAVDDGIVDCVCVDTDVTFSAAPDKHCHAFICVQEEAVWLNVLTLQPALE